MATQVQTAEALAQRIAALDEERRYDDALAAFRELAALDPADDAVREATVEAGVELAYELALSGRDRPAAESVHRQLSALHVRFPEDDVVIGGLAAAAAVLSALCTIEKDWKAAADYAVAINQLNQGVPEELSRELDLQYGRTAATYLVGLVQDEQWAQARSLTYSLRELLLADFMLADLAEQKGAAAADDIRKLFEAMIDAFREAEPEAAARIDADVAERKGVPVQEPQRSERSRVEPRFDFETLKDVTIYGFVSMRVPARWPEARAENGRGGFWEEDVESGTLWIDWDLYSFKGEEPRDSAPPAIRIQDEGEKAIKYRRYESFERGEPLVIHHWWVNCGTPGRILMIHFNLVLLADLAQRDDFQPLPGLIAREIRAARIDFSRIPTGAD